MEHQNNHYVGNSSNNTSTTTSRHTSTASMFSLVNFHQPHSRNPTPPTPMSSPGLYSPPHAPPSDKAVMGPHLHPSQYRQPEQNNSVKETHLLDLDFDPISGRKIINHYSIIDEIGRGVHGKVKLGTDLDTGELVAIKIVERSQDRPRLGRRGDGESEKKVRREIAILKKCRHENVVRLLEVIDDPQSKKVYLILEYVQLGEIIWRKPGVSYVPSLTIEQARCTFRDTVLGLEYLHYHGIIHRDIKPANLLWTQNHRVKISDFGVSFLGRPIRDYEDGCDGEEATGLEQNELELAKTAGTPAFFAPELCHVDHNQPRPQITSAIDVWALGVTLYCLVFARCPFMADNEFQLLRVIAKDELVIPDRRPIDVDLKDLLKRLLTKDPTRRITLKEVKRHPWVLHGIVDPCAWVDETDPERMSDGNKIEVTVEDVEKAVSSAGVLHRARSAVKRAVEWGKGLRRRASSTANVISTKDMKILAEKEREVTTTRGCPSAHLGDDDGELRWMGSNPQWRDEDKSPLSACSAANNATSSDFVRDGGGYGGFNGESSDPNSPRRSDSESQRLQRKCSSALGTPSRRHAIIGSEPSGTNAAFHRTHGTLSQGGPTENPHVSWSDTSLRAPSYGHHAGSLIGNGMRRVVRSMKSGGFHDNGDKVKGSASREGSPLRARDSLAGALRGDHSFYAYGTGSLHVQIPNGRRHSYAGIDVDGGSVIDNNRLPAIDYKPRWDRDIGRKFASFTMKDKPCPTSPDDEVSMERIWERDQQKAFLRHEEHNKYSSPRTSNSDVTPGWTKESYYYPSQDSPTPPIMMERKSRGFFDDHIQMPMNSSQPNHLISSSSEERFATTAGSSLTNSTSFPSVPSIMSETSSISSEFFNSRYSRKNSIAGIVHEEEFDTDYRPPTPFHQSRLSNIKQIESDNEREMDADLDDDDDSDGGFVMEVPPSKKKSVRSESVTASELARRPLDSIEPMLRTGRRSRSSSATLKDKKVRRGRAKDKVVTEA
ncbi:kinase-like protein [Choiromyces venosus 120613-1]|uniref:non-specific serine/threonine protein kinase n=1 Tax=Choiromyces venosus 120613-1 TaxID=1336337 RepID=A0A3N4K708_9PEZI|nr:kinase-like protein [Choiromyces venosus 120613-1]